MSSTTIVRAYIVSLVILGLLLGSFVYANTRDVREPTQASGNYSHWTLVAETESSATSSILDIKGAKKVEFYFIRNGDSTSVATSTFEVEVTPDGTNWYDYNKLISNTTNSNSQELTRIETTTIIGATSTTIVAMDLEHDVFRGVRCLASFTATSTEETDSNLCKASVEF